MIAIYNEHKDKLENDLEEISTALTCIVSIKDYHEEMISQANFKDIPKGIIHPVQLDSFALQLRGNTDHAPPPPVLILLNQS